ncbi:MAG: HD domain-containing protein [Lachnospiraceae bacterium]|nr:HD domain-containing protein [Lachnospiraceae bacterium]
MNPRTLLDILSVAENLKNQTRHSYTSSGRQESVAEHSWRMAFAACFLADEFLEADLTKVIKMCLFHDIGESFTGDIPCFEKNETHEQTEQQCLTAWLATLPSPYREEYQALFDEMEQCQTLEAKLYKALDKLEAVDQHNHADLSTWIPLEYDLQLTHGEKQVAFSPYLKSLKSEINTDTLKKIKNIDLPQK